MSTNHALQLAGTDLVRNLGDLVLEVMMSVHPSDDLLLSHELSHGIGHAVEVSLKFSFRLEAPDGAVSLM